MGLGAQGWGERWKSQTGDCFTDPGFQTRRKEEGIASGKSWLGGLLGLFPQDYPCDRRLGQGLEALVTHLPSQPPKGPTGAPNHSGQCP